MAYAGKPVSTSIGNFHPTNMGRNASKISAVDSKSSNDSHTRITGNNSKPHPHKNSMSNKRFNSGTPCISKAFTPLGKPSAISSRENPEKHKDITSRRVTNDHNFVSFKESRGTKGFNSGTPCTSNAFTLLGKSSTVSTVKPPAKCKGFAFGSAVNVSKPPLLIDTSPNKEFNSVTPSTPKASTSLGNLSAINTMKNAVKSKNSILGEVRKNMSPTVKDFSYNIEQQHLIKSSYLQQSSTTLIKENPAESKAFIPGKIANDSMTPHSKNTKTNEDFTSGTSRGYEVTVYTSLRKSSIINTIENTEKKNYFVDGKTVSVTKSPPLKHHTPYSVQQRLMRYYTFLETKYDVKTEKNSVKDKDFMSEQPVYDSRRTSAQDTTSGAVHQSCTNNELHTDFGIVHANNKVKEPVRSKIYPKYNENRSSSTVDLLRCIICIDKERDTVFQPCGHLVVCSKCSKDVDSICPMCRKRIKKKIKAYIN